MRVLVLTLSVGSGHVRAARSIASELKRLSEDVEVCVCDALEDCWLPFRAAYVWPYWAMIRYAPATWGRFFRARVNNMHERTAPAWAFRSGCSKVFSLIEKFRPDVIVASEVAASEMAVIAKRAGLTNARIINVITDHEAEPVWVKPEVEIYAAPDDYVRDQLIQWGAPSEKIVICGIPVDPAFTESNPRSMRSSAVENDSPLVLLMGGGMGPTRMDLVARRLVDRRIPVRIIAVTGHDTRARRRLSRLRAGFPSSLKVLGWTDNVAALMREASILVTKPGGLTLAEAAICSLPVVMFDPIPGPEERNALRVSRGGAGLLTKGWEKTTDAIIFLLNDALARKTMSTKSRSLACHGAAESIAGLALGAARFLPKSLPESRRMTA